MSAVNTEFKVSNTSFNLTYNKGFNSYELIIHEQANLTEINATFDALHLHSESLNNKYPGNIRVSISLKSDYSINPGNLLCKLCNACNMIPYSVNNKFHPFQFKYIEVNRDYLVLEVTFCDKFKMPNGPVSIGGGFGIVINKSKTHVLVITQCRADGTEKKQQPGGGVGFGEDPLSACLREVTEETGLTLETVMKSDIRLLYQRDQSNARPGGISDSMKKYLIFVDDELINSTLKTQTDDHVTSVCWVPINEIELEYKAYLEGDTIAKSITAQGGKGENPYKKNGVYRDDFLNDVISVVRGREGYPLKVSQKGDKVNVELY